MGVVVMRVMVMVVVIVSAVEIWEKFPQKLVVKVTESVIGIEHGDTLLGCCKFLYFFCYNR